MKFIVTTTQSALDVDYLSDYLHETKLEYIPRKRQSLSWLARDNDAHGVIVCETGGPILYIQDEKFFFHPSMAKNRIAAYRNKHQKDLLIEACQLSQGDDFLDCTLGMGADAIVAAFFSDSGKITGLESHPVIASIIKWGMKTYKIDLPWLYKAIRKVEAINADHRFFLSELANKSYDVVYFDPMFSRPVLKSQAIAPLRILANHKPINGETVQEACRVARKRVVIKTLKCGMEIDRLGFKEIAGSKHNPITYGVIDAT